jgi:VacB/RNase II family 3'-5' exoribonuclease
VDVRSDKVVATDQGVSTGVTPLEVLGLYFSIPMTRPSTDSSSLDLIAIANRSMIDNGFEPDFSEAARQQIQSILKQRSQIAADDSRRDLRTLLWSSIDDGKTRDLDQVEYAETLPDGETRLLIGIADVDVFVAKNSAIDQHAARNCTSVYTGVKTFPMLPEELSNDLTSLVENEDRLAVVTELVFAADSSVKKTDVYPARVRNRAKLSYEGVGAWLDKSGPLPSGIKEVSGMETQIKLQADLADRLAEFRKKQGAIDLGTIQSVPVTDEHGKVVGLKVIESSTSRDLIANFMIAANVAMAEFLEKKGGPSLRRVVRTPEHWDRIVEIADAVGEKLPTKPDSKALADFLSLRRKADPEHFPDLSLAVVKALGPGEYVLLRAGQDGEGHFGLAVQDYTHSTAPNRRFADLVTQRLVKAALLNSDSPYNETELRNIAARCTEREDASRKVERKMRKVAAALLMKDQIGNVFDAIVTGVTEKGTFARVIRPPVDGRVERGEKGLRVGEKVKVRLLSTDPERGFIDFARV